MSDAPWAALVNIAGNREHEIAEAVALRRTLVGTRQAATILGMSIRTLEHWRATGVGPGFVRIGRRGIRYEISALTQFLAGDRVTTPADTL